MSGEESCTACAAGSYKDYVGNGSCSLCPILSFSPPSSTSLSSCTCVNDTVVVEGACMCEAGRFFNSQLGLPGSCDACPPHSWSEVGAQSLLNCTCEYPFTGPAGGPCEYNLAEWSVANSTPSGARFGGAAVDLGQGKGLWVFGGVDDALGSPYTPVSDVLLNPGGAEAGSSWTVASLGAGGPVARYLHTASRLDSTVIVFGGYGAGGALLGDLWAFDATSASSTGYAWASMDAGNVAPGARAGHCAAAAEEPAGVGGGSVWVFGGEVGSGTVSGELWELRVSGMDAGGGISWLNHTATDGWVEGRSKAGMAHIQGSLYVFGGVDGAGAGVDDGILLKYEIQSGEWSSLGGAPSARQGHSVFAVGPRLWLFGGWKMNGVATNELWDYTTINLTYPLQLQVAQVWTQRTPVVSPSARGWAAVAPPSGTSPTVWLWGGLSGSSALGGDAWLLNTKIVVCPLGFGR